MKFALFWVELSPFGIIFNGFFKPLSAQIDLPYILPNTGYRIDRRGSIRYQYIEYIYVI